MLQSPCFRRLQFRRFFIVGESGPYRGQLITAVSKHTGKLNVGQGWQELCTRWESCRHLTTALRNLMGAWMGLTNDVRMFIASNCRFCHGKHRACTFCGRERRMEVKQCQWFREIHICVCTLSGEIPQEQRIAYSGQGTREKTRRK